MKRMPPVFVVFAFFVFITSCNKERTDNVPQKDIAYGKHFRQKMDISLPPNASEKNPVPIAFFIHGGSWSGGDKTDFDWMQQSANNYQLAYVTINYRLLKDQVTYKEMLEDIHSAISFLKTNSDTYYLETDKMFLMGNSAGGHLALLYAYSMNSPIPIACIASQVGPTDFCDPEQIKLNGKENLSLINKLIGTNITSNQLDQPDFSFPESWKRASPIYHVSENSPPTVLGYGQKDELVAYSNATRLKEKLEQQEVHHNLIIFPNSGHGLNQDPESSTQFWNTLSYFVDTYLK